MLIMVKTKKLKVQYILILRTKVTLLWFFFHIIYFEKYYVDMYMTCEEKIYSNEYLDVIIEFGEQVSQIDYYTKDYCYQMISTSLGIASVRRSDDEYYDMSLYGYAHVPKLYTIVQNEFDEFNLFDAGIIEAQLPPFNLLGQGVLIGFLDSGIDYMNKAFRNADGTTRIRAIWDQTVSGANKPNGFLYGSLYTKEDIDRAILSENPYDIVPVKDENTHGSQIASVAAGSVLENGFSGAAPLAEIIVVKLKPAKEYLREYYLVPENTLCYAENDILAALAFIDSFAIPLVKPLVTCFALGSNLGAHCAESVLSHYISALMEKKSRAIVVSAGNEADKQHHKRGVLSLDNREDDIEINVTKSEGFVFEFWGKSPYLYTFNIRTPQGEEVPFVPLRDTGIREYRFVRSESVVYIDSVLIEGNTGNQLIFVRILNPTDGIWQLRVRNSGERFGGEYNIYLPMEQMLSGNVRFLESEVMTTIVEPGYANNALCITPYDAHNNSILTYSGRGFGNCGEIKPDLAAPGTRVYTAYGIGEGSSYATAIATGGVAQLLQWGVVNENNILMDAQLINNYFVRSATRMQTIEYPNPVWGYGIYNVNSIFEFFATIL